VRRYYKRKEIKKKEVKKNDETRIKKKSGAVD